MWEVSWTPADGETAIELGEDGEADGIFLASAPTIGAPERRVGYAQAPDGDGSRTTSTKYGNRQITIPLLVNCSTQAEYFAVQQSLMAAIDVSKRKEGELLLLAPEATEGVTYDVVGVALQDFEIASPFAPGLQPFTLVFEVLPYGRRESVAVAGISSSDPVAVYSLTGIPGSAPALGQLTLTDLAGQKRRLIAWGVDLDTGTRFYEAEASPFGALNGAAANAGPSGSHGGTANKTILQGSLTTSYAEMLGTTTSLTDVGSFRILARVHAPSANAGHARAQLRWAVGGQFDAYETNGSVDIADDGAWHIVDLGTVNIPEPSVGNPAWDMRIAAKGTSAGDDLYIDWIVLMPVGYADGEVESLDASGDGVVLANKSLVIRHDGSETQRTSTTWSPPGDRGADRPLFIPPGDSRLIVLQSRGKYGETDVSTDSLGIGLNVIPREGWLAET